MEERMLWGERGEYGPFSSQADGWPNAGEIIRYYRKHCSMSADQLAEEYGQTINAQITRRWILKMEQLNLVPTDITRRKALSTILSTSCLIRACLVRIRRLCT